MKLLLVISFYPPHYAGGYELRCKEVVSGLIKRGHEVIIITSRCPEPKCDLHKNEENIFRVLHPKKVKFNFFSQIFHDISDLKLLENKMEEFNPDIIYLWHLDALSNAIFPFLSQQKKQIVIDEGYSEILYFYEILKKGIYFDNNKNELGIKKLLKSFINFVIYVFSRKRINPNWSWPKNVFAYFNNSYMLKIIQDKGIHFENTKVIQSGLDLSKFPFSAHETIGCPITILTPGRIHPKKGTLDSILLTHELLKNNIKVKLLFIGNDESESQRYLNKINNVIKDMKLSEFIEYQPMISQNDLAHIYRKSDFCFFPSYLSTGFSRIPLEAMASGCVVITYGNESSQEIFHNQETGFIVNEGDLVSAATMIKRLIQNPDRHKKVIKNARKQIENEYQIDRYIEKIEDYLYESLGNSKIETPIE